MRSDSVRGDFGMVHKLSIVSFAVFLVVPLVLNVVPLALQSLLNSLSILVISGSCVWLVLQKKIPFLLGYQDLLVFIVIVYFICLIELGYYENEYGYQKLIKVTQVIVIYCILLPRLFYSTRAQNAAWTTTAYLAFLLCVSIILTAPWFSGRTNFLGINPIWIGRFCGILSIFCACSYIYSSRFTSKQCFFGFVLGLFAILLTGSKGPFLGVLVAIGLLYLSNKKLKSKFVVFVSLLLGSALYIFVIGAGDLEGSALSRFSSAEVDSTIDEGYRTVLYEVAFELAINNYIGFGSGGFIGHTLADYPHNIFLELAVEFGLIVMSVFMLLVVFLTLRIFKLRSVNSFEFAFLSSMFLYELINSMVSGNITSPRFLYLALVLIPTIRYSQVKRIS